MSGILRKIFIVDNEPDGFTLKGLPIWAVDPFEDYVEFFNAVVDLLPPGTFLCLDEPGKGKDLQDFLNSAKVIPDAKIEMPKSWRSEFMVHILATGVNLQALAQLVKKFDPLKQEICIGLYAYSESGAIMEFNDFDHGACCGIFLSRSLPEEKVKRFCDRLKTTYSEETPELL